MATEDPEHDYDRCQEEMDAYLEGYSHLEEINLGFPHQSRIRHLFHLLMFYSSSQQKTGETKPIGPHNQFDSSEFNTEFGAVEDFFTEDCLRRRWAGIDWETRHQIIWLNLSRTQMINL